MGAMFSNDPYLEGVIVIDVRSKEEFNGGHVDDAILIPHTQIKDKIGEYGLDKEPPINLGAAGSRAGFAKSTLLGMGYTHASNDYPSKAIEIIIINKKFSMSAIISHLFSF